VDSGIERQGSASELEIRVSEGLVDKGSISKGEGVDRDKSASGEAIDGSNEVSVG